jgi:hypothetical protein
MYKVSYINHITIKLEKKSKGLISSMLENIEVLLIGFFDNFLSFGLNCGPNLGLDIFIIKMD